MSKTNSTSAKKTRDPLYRLALAICATVPVLSFRTGNLPARSIPWQRMYTSLFLLWYSLIPKSQPIRQVYGVDEFVPASFETQSWVKSIEMSNPVEWPGYHDVDGLVVTRQGRAWGFQIDTEGFASVTPWRYGNWWFASAKIYLNWGVQPRNYARNT